MKLLDRAREAGIEFRHKGAHDFQYKLPSSIYPDIEVLADIEENRDELLAQLRAEVPKDCAKCGSLDIGPGGILCDQCLSLIHISEPTRPY